MMKEPTEIQIATVMYWYDYYQKHGSYPSLRTAANHFGVYPRAVTNRMHFCSKKGLTFQTYGKWKLTNAGRELCEGQ